MAEIIDLSGTVALVTGAARGIGRATAIRLARCGARLAICDRHDDELTQTADDLSDAGAQIHAEALDVRDADQVTRFVTAARDRLGPTTLLVNNAGGTFVAPFLDVTAKGEASLIAENFTQATHLVRSVAPTMPDGGSIVNVTSIEAHQAAPGFAVYAAMKAALDNLTRSLALELGPRGIRVNAVAPDALPSTGEREARQALLRGPVPYDPAFVPPLGWFGTPDDAASVILFLASPLASFVTGCTIHVDGGNHAAGGWHLRGETATTGTGT
jgi:3-oxoacyl-[acyl-carrier protein] reductase